MRGEGKKGWELTFFEIRRYHRVAVIKIGMRITA